MQKSKKENYQEIISIEEYLNRRQKVKEQKKTQEKEKSPIVLLTGLFV